MRDIKAEAVTEALRHDDVGRFDVTLIDGDGRSTTLSLTASVAADLLQVLSEYCVQAPVNGGPEATRLPSEFSVGSGRFEHLVLLRFEKEAPYGFAPADARELGEALLAQAEEIEAAPLRLRH